MAYYIITYDLRKKPGHDYKPLYDQLNSWGAKHLQDSVWFANMTGRAEAVRDSLRRHAHADDTFCVIQVFPNSDWATVNARTEGTVWLHAHMTQVAA
jgi:CRISPR/Cas system-associated endoribonuclease Cas2